jgi:hypothetical protein
VRRGLIINIIEKDIRMPKFMGFGLSVKLDPALPRCDV